MNDGRVRTAQPCIKFIGDPKLLEPPYAPTKAEDWERCPPHATKEEAERHFYDFCLEQAKEHDGSHWMDCAKCGAATKKMLGNMGLGDLFHIEPLCDEHRTKEVLADLHPFAPGIAMVHS